MLRFSFVVPRVGGRRVPLRVAVIRLRCDHYMYSVMYSVSRPRHTAMVRLWSVELWPVCCRAYLAVSISRAVSVPLARVFGRHPVTVLMIETVFLDVAYQH